MVIDFFQRLKYKERGGVRLYFWNMIYFGRRPGNEIAVALGRQRAGS